MHFAFPITCPQDEVAPPAVSNGTRFAKPQPIPGVTYITYDAQSRRVKQKQLAAIKDEIENQAEEEYDFSVRDSARRAIERRFYCAHNQWQSEACLVALSLSTFTVAPNHHWLSQMVQVDDFALTFVKGQSPSTGSRRRTRGRSAGSDSEDNTDDEGGKRDTAKSLTIPGLLAKHSTASVNLIRAVEVLPARTISCHLP